MSYIRGWNYALERAIEIVKSNKSKDKIIEELKKLKVTYVNS